MLRSITLIPCKKDWKAAGLSEKFKVIRIVNSLWFSIGTIISKSDVEDLLGVDSDWEVIIQLEV